MQTQAGNVAGGGVFKTADAGTSWQNVWVANSYFARIYATRQEFATHS